MDDNFKLMILAQENLTTNQILLLDTIKPKSIFICYVFWFFLWYLPLIDLYLGRFKVAGIRVAVLFFTLGLGTLIWSLVDTFTIPGVVNRLNYEKKKTAIIYMIGQNEKES